MTATETDIQLAPSVRVKHSWREEPRAEDPRRHIRTCTRSGCGLRKRSEQHPDTGRWGELWLWPDGESGDTFSGEPVPSCRGERKPKRQASTSVVVLTPVPVMREPKQSPSRRCRRCNPPCGREGRLYLGGLTCDVAAGAAARAREDWLNELRSPTSNLGVSA